MSAIMATSVTSCDDNNSENTGDLSAKEQTLKDAVTPYVNNTVITTDTNTNKSNHILTPKKNHSK